MSCTRGGKSGTDRAEKDQESSGIQVTACWPSSGSKIKGTSLPAPCVCFAPSDQSDRVGIRVRVPERNLHWRGDAYAKA
jgi:hypothetical protein